MSRSSLWVAVAMVVSGVEGVALAAFTDNFDSFSVGSVGGQGSWTYVGPPSPYGADVVDSPAALSGSNSLRFTDDGTAWVTATRNIDSAQSAGDGAKIRFSFKALQPTSPVGVTGLLLEPFRQGIDTGGNYEFSPIAHAYLYVEPSGTILYADQFAGTSTTVFSAWQADRWYTLEMTSHIVGDNVVNDVAVIDPADNSVLASVQGLTGGLSASRHYYSYYQFSTDGSRAGSYLVDDVKLLAPVPGWAVQSGDWNIASNWVGPIPNAVGAVAQFTGSINSPATVYSNTAVTVGEIVFDNANTYVLSGAGSLTIDVESGSGSVSVLNGSHKINLPLLLNDSTTAEIAAGAQLTISDPMTLVGGAVLTKTGPGTLSIEAPVTNAAPASFVSAAGVSNLHSDLSTFTSASVSGGTLNLYRSQHLAALSVSGGQVIVGPGSNIVLAVNDLSISGSGNIDLKNGKLIVDYVAASPIGDLQAAIVSGSLTSSMLGAGFAIGLGEASDLFTSFPAIFAGESVDSTSVLAAHTVVADANLDGTVSSSDFNLLVANYGTLAGSRWTQGDFNGDQKVNTIDFNLLAGQFGQSLPPAAALGAVVPEPASLAVLCVALPLLRRRR